ncbi:MAG: hypothetical protein Q8P31_06575 [Bacillota bacterium]|nr:hypothetical protein [Bacillota bacterium]
MANIDRRIIYVIMMLAVIYAFIKPMGLPITVSQHTKTAYNAIDALPAGSILVLGMDFSAGGIPELEPAGKAIFYQCMKNNVRVVFMGMWVMAGDMAERILTEMEPLFPDKKYGVDYINIGYKAGGAPMLEKAVDDIVLAAVGIDHRGNALPGNMAIMQDFKSLKDVSFWVCLSTGTPGTGDWIRIVGDPLKIKGTTDIVSVSIPEQMPYVQSGQLTGIIQGMRGSAEYELLIKRPGRAVAGMDAQSLTHVVILAFILLGNLGYLVRKKS